VQIRLNPLERTRHGSDIDLCLPGCLPLTQAVEKHEADGGCGAGGRADVGQHEGEPVQPMPYWRRSGV